MSSVSSRGKVKIEELRSNPTRREERDDLRGPDPFPGIFQATPELIPTLNVEAWRPGFFNLKQKKT